MKGRLGDRLEGPRVGGGARMEEKGKQREEGDGLLAERRLAEPFGRSSRHLRQAHVDRCCVERGVKGRNQE